jgi:hypothetical protein
MALVKELYTKLSASLLRTNSFSSTVGRFKATRNIYVIEIDFFDFLWIYSAPPSAGIETINKRRKNVHEYASV